MLVGRFVFVGDAVEIEVVGNLAFLVALDFLALQGADVVAADVVPVFAPVPEFVLALVGRELVAEPFQHGPREPTVSEQVDDDALQEFEQCAVALGGGCERGSLAVGLADDRQAQAVECTNGHAARRSWAEALADPLLHLVAGVACEGQEQQFGRAPVSSLDEPAGLGHDDRGLAAAGCGDDQVAVVVEDDGMAQRYACPVAMVLDAYGLQIAYGDIP